MSVGDEVEEYLGKVADVNAATVALAIAGTFELAVSKTLAIAVGIELGDAAVTRRALVEMLRRKADELEAANAVQTDDAS